VVPDRWGRTGVALLLALGGCGVLYEHRRSPDEEFRALRPLWTERRRLDPPESRATFLWPLGVSRSNREGAMCRLFPLHVRYLRHRTAGTASVGITLGLLLTGDSPETGPYGALFPLGGSLRQWWLKERIDFVLFPAWVHTHEGRSRLVFRAVAVLQRCQGIR
jgi:hypothetical protein